MATTFNDLKHTVSQKFVSGFGKAIPVGLLEEEREAHLNEINVNAFPGLSQMTGIFTDIDGKRLSFVVGPKAVNFDVVEKTINRPKEYDPVISEGSGDYFVRGGGYNEVLRAEVQGPASISSGDYKQWYSVRLWSENSNIYAAIQKAYIKVYPPRDSYGWGFQFYDRDPVTTSSTTSLSLSMMYKLLSVTVSWTDSNITSYAGRDYADVTYKPNNLFQNEISYVDQQTENGLGFKFTAHYISESPAKKYAGSVYAYIDYVDAVTAITWTDSISSSSTPYYITKG